MFTHMYITCMIGAYQGQKILCNWLKVQIVVSHPLGAGTQTQAPL